MTPDGGDGAARRPVVQARQGGAGRPMGELLGRVRPQRLGQLLRSAEDAAVLIVGVGVDDAQDLEDGVREVRVPATRAETDLPERLTRRETGLLERFGGGDEAVERLLVHRRHELVPDLLDALRVTSADGVLHLGEARAVVDGGLPRVRDVAEELRQFVGRARVVRLAAELDDGARRDVRQRVRERLRLEAHRVDVVVERAAGDGKTHATEVGDDVRGGAETVGAQPATDAVGLVDDGLEAQLHQLVRGDEA